MTSGADDSRTDENSELRMNVFSFLELVTRELMIINLMMFEKKTDYQCI